MKCDFKILEVLRGEDALKLVDKHNEENYSYFDYKETIESQEMVVLKYSVTIPEGTKTSEYGVNPNIDISIKGTDKDTFKYKGLTYIGMRAYKLRPDGSEVKLKAGETGEYYIAYSVPKGCTDSEYLLEISGYKAGKDYFKVK